VKPAATSETPTASAAPPVPEQTLHEVIEALAPIERPPGSPGEREAAEWLERRFRAAGVKQVEVEQGPHWGTFPPTATALSGLGVTGAALVLMGRRVTGALAALAAFAGILDEAENGPRVFRRALRRKQSLVNVVARLGDPEAERTLVVLAHHDAPQTGAIFDQTLQRKAFEVAPKFMDRFKTSIPHWWGALAGPLATIAAAVSGRRAGARAGVALGLVSTGIVADIWRSPTVPGANDNLSGVAGLVGLAEMLRERPPSGLRVLLVSAGAEESLQDGIRAFMDSHAHELPVERTWFINFETTGSPFLASLEGEGPVAMRDYSDPSFRELVAGLASGAGIPLERGLRGRVSTDSVIPSRAGYPTVTLASITFWRGLANYHWPTDVPENVDYGTVADSVRLGYLIAESLAAGDPRVAGA